MGWQESGRDVRDVEVAGSGAWLRARGKGTGVDYEGQEGGEELDKQTEGRRARGRDGE